ncbi:hypothetical protein [Paenibacillus illinoisensis]|uniref:Uncharacterized protein n=1 Tax=Paenibacillus illinoisensis TaxID=59845 RepID=A0A2W0CQ20_9BACL|nr:hypothetical protein [Paenibacillus illinoisensis]PYY29748.1 Uncharacterized protein PIL02S_01948 [Paenibacillus illinoisensis]
MLKKFRFWLFFLSLLICVYNATGLDDKNLLLFLTSPHLLLLVDYSRYIRAIGNEEIQMLIWYVINVIGWFLIGWLVDSLITKLKRK